MRKHGVSEKQEQSAIVQLLESLGAKVYILGTTRAKKCHACGEVTKDFSTRQTPGIPDLYAILPGHAKRPYPYRLTPIWIEVKSKQGRLSDEQREFRQLCSKSVTIHIVGACDDVQNWLVDHGWLKESQRRSA